MQSAVCSVLLNTVKTLISNKNPAIGGDFPCIIRHYGNALEKNCILLTGFGPEFLEHSRVRQEIRIIEFLCTARAVGRAGTAFNTGTRNIRRVVRVYRAHRTQLGAQAALFAQHCHCARLGLEELLRAFCQS